MATPLLHSPKPTKTKPYVILNGHGQSVGKDNPHKLLVPFDGTLLDPLFQLNADAGKTVDVELSIVDGSMITTYKKNIKEGMNEVPDFSFPVKRGQVLCVRFQVAVNYVFSFVLERS